MDNLIATAEQNTSFPLYCFYCGGWSSTGKTIASPGCSIASAYEVKARAKAISLSQLQPIMHPWEILVCGTCLHGSAPPPDDLVSTVHAALQRLSLAEVQSGSPVAILFFDRVTQEGISLPDRVLQVLNHDRVIVDDPTLAGMIILQGRDSRGQE